MLLASADGPLPQISGTERGHTDTTPAFVLTKAVPSEGTDSDIVLAGNLQNVLMERRKQTPLAC